MNIKWLMYIALIFYNGVDVWNTSLLLKLGAYEANPIVTYFIHLLGPVPGMIIIKSIPLVALGLYLLHESGLIYMEKRMEKNLT